MPRDKALREVKKPNQIEISAICVPFDPRLPSISSSIAKHWRPMVGQDRYFNEVLKQPPLIAYRRQHNLTAVSTHYHCCNFLVSLQFAHIIYQVPKKILPISRFPNFNQSNQNLQRLYIRGFVWLVGHLVGCTSYLGQETTMYWTGLDWTLLAPWLTFLMPYYTFLTPW